MHNLTMKLQYKLLYIFRIIVSCSNCKWLVTYIFKIECIRITETFQYFYLLQNFYPCFIPLDSNKLFYGNSVSLKMCFLCGFKQNRARFFLLNNCVKSVQVRSFFWSVFSRIWTRKNSVFGHFSYSEELHHNKIWVVMDFSED